MLCCPFPSQRAEHCKYLGRVPKCCAPEVPLPGQAAAASQRSLPCSNLSPSLQKEESLYISFCKVLTLLRGPMSQRSTQIPAGTHTFGSFSSESGGQSGLLSWPEGVTLPVPATWTKHRAEGISTTAERHRPLHHFPFHP